MDSPVELLEALRALDRRLLAVEGSGNEPEQLEVELTAIASELAALGTAHGVAVTVPEDVSVDTEALRASVRAWVDRLISSHPELKQAEPLADQAPGEEELVLRQRTAVNAKVLSIGTFVVVIAALAGIWIYDRTTTRNEVREAARTICERPPPCEGDEPEIALWRRISSRGRTHYALVLHLESADCSRRLEEFYDADGSYNSRVSPGDDLYAWRHKVYLEDYVEISRVACEAVDELLP